MVKIPPPSALWFGLKTTKINLGKNSPKFKILLDLLENLRTQFVNLKTRSTNSTLIFQDFISAIYIRANWSQNQPFIRFIWKLALKVFWGCWIQIWHRHLTIFYSKSKFGQVSLKTKISLDLLEYLHMSQVEGNKDEYDSNILKNYT